MKNRDLATFGGGCFWCIEAIIQMLDGVEKVESGYAGGHTKNPDYRSVCAGITGHTEVVQVTFDPEKISYKDLITIFMTSHDPTTPNRQGADAGTQYRSAIYYHDEAQKASISAVFAEIKSSFNKPIVTEVAPLDQFYVAEVSHQDYYNANPNAGYCRVVIDPKIQKLRARYADKLKKESA